MRAHVIRYTIRTDVYTRIIQAKRNSCCIDRSTCIQNRKLDDTHKYTHNNKHTRIARRLCNTISVLVSLRPSVTAHRFWLVCTKYEVEVLFCATAVLCSYCCCPVHFRSALPSRFFVCFGSPFCLVCFRWVWSVRSPPELVLLFFFFHGFLPFFVSLLLGDFCVCVRVL